jgi:hypothetical protein
VTSSSLAAGLDDVAALRELVLAERDLQLRDRDRDRDEAGHRTRRPSPTARDRPRAVRAHPASPADRIRIVLTGEAVASGAILGALELMAWLQPSSTARRSARRCARRVAARWRARSTSGSRRSSSATTPALPHLTSPQAEGRDRGRHGGTRHRAPPTRRRRSSSRRSRRSTRRRDRRLLVQLPLPDHIDENRSSRRSRRRRTSTGSTL